jgi:hypothetical protein
MRSGIIVVALVLIGCGDSKQPASPEGAENAWRSAGLEVSALEPTEVAALDGATCKAGTVSQVHVTLCELADADAARKAESKGLTLIGKHTGASLARGNLLLVVADRDTADPQGKTINTLTKSFRQLEVAAKPAEPAKPD